MIMKGLEKMIKKQNREHKNFVRQEILNLKQYMSDYQTQKKMQKVVIGIKRGKPPAFHEISKLDHKIDKFFEKKNKKL